ncbi:acyltransferase family protein [Flavobacterium psychrotolerans]|uniref:Acyltransferase 3 domain-containing protein n=1 Tax=Flavobacterium psychrotolerans TaxID=2169410 RepID=A0A2U1JGN3_9FLAO|nr:acyltransferase [Flavobacterium psychrotolerans]PWA04185.1 hypothetical protein DB895_12455 [Flavobacterium psychrotolerans]
MLSFNGMITEQSAKRIFGLDLIRATAILMVLCSHILSIYPNVTNKLTQVFILFGYWGVEIFFVLSGFLIGNILYKLYIKDDFTIHSVFSFLKRRWLRTLPNYFLILLLNIVLAFAFNFFMQDVGYYFFFFQNFSHSMRPFFSESWSLSVEEFAYLFTPFALLIPTLLVKSKNKSKWFISVVLFLILIFLFNKIIYYFTTSNTTIEQWNVSLKAVVIYRIDSILIGIAASWISLNFGKFWMKQKATLFFLGCGLLIVMFVGVGFFGIFINTHPFFWDVLYLPITSVTFALFLPVFSQWKSAPSWLSKPIIFVSLISYSVYLLHYSIVLQLMKFCFDTASFSVLQLHFFTFFYLVTTFLLSFCLYKFFEKPIMDLRGGCKID